MLKLISIFSISTNKDMESPLHIALTLGSDMLFSLLLFLDRLHI